MTDTSPDQPELIASELDLTEASSDDLSEDLAAEVAAEVAAELAAQREASSRISDRTFGIILTILGAIAFVASMALSIEKYLKLINPDHVASCSLNIFLDCSEAMASHQGAIFGFPNPYIGVAAFAVVTTVGVSMLAGAKYPKWFMIALLVGTTLGLAMIIFLIYTSIHVLQRLCPYCLVVWAMMFPLFWYQIVRGVQERYLPASERVRAFIMRNRNVIWPLFYLAVILWIALGMGGTIVDYLRQN